MPLLLIFVITQVFIAAQLSGQDPEMPLNRTLSLPEVIPLALERNLTLQRSQVQVELRENDLVFREADSQANLNATVGGSLRYSGDGRDAVWNTGDLTNSASGNLSSSLVIYNGGEREAALKQARSSLEAGIREYDRSKQFVLFQSVFRYLEAVLRLKEIDIQSEELAIRKEDLERIKVGYENEIRILADVLRQQALVADSERRLVQAQQTHETILYILKDLLLLPPQTKIQFNLDNSRWGETESLPEPLIEQSLIRIANRPDLLAQQYRLEAADQGIRIAKSGLLPTLTASANLRTSYSSVNTSGSFATQYFKNQPDLSGGVTFSIPIFDRRRTETNVSRATLQRRQEEIDLIDLQQVAETDLRRALLDFRTATAQLVFSQNQLRSSEEALQAEQARYDAGAATLLDVNSLRSTRLDAAVAVEEAWFSLFTSRLDIAFQDGTIENFLLSQLETSIPELE